MNLETERLLMRPLTAADAPHIQQHFPHWDIVKYLSKESVTWPYPADGAEKYIRNIVEPRTAAGDDWFWAITLKGDPDRLIGVIHLRRFSESGNRSFWIAQAHQGKGYMTEVLAAVNDYAFNVLGFEEMIVKNARENTGSHNLKPKSGAVLVEVRPAQHYIGGCTEQEVWHLTKAAWQASRQPRPLAAVPQKKSASRGKIVRLVPVQRRTAQPKTAQPRARRRLG